MSNRQQTNTRDWSKFAPLLMGIVVLCVFAVFLIVMFIKPSATIVLFAAVFLGLAATGLIVGCAWDQPTYQPRNRSSMRGAFFAILAYWVFVSAIRFKSVTLTILLLAAILAATLIPFTVARLIARRRTT